MFKDNRLRLLMTLAGFERLEVDDEPGAPWIIPTSLTSAQLNETYNLIDNYLKNPMTHYGEENSVPAEEMLRRKVAPRPRADFDDDSDGDGEISASGEDFLFPKGGPTTRVSDALAELKKRRRRQRVDTASENEIDGIDDEKQRAKRKARALADLERQRRLKSDVLVHTSDEEEDEERDRQFFAREEETRRNHTLKVLEVLKAAQVDDALGTVGMKRKGKNANNKGNKKVKLSDANSESDEEPLPLEHGAETSSPQDLHLDTSDVEASETPLSSPQQHPLKEIEINRTFTERDAERSRVNKTAALSLNEDDEGEDSLLPVANRVRGRAAVLDDSDDD